MCAQRETSVNPQSPGNAGRTFTRGDKTYYSPNCDREVRVLPEPTSHDIPKNIFLPRPQFKALHGEPKDPARPTEKSKQYDMSSYPIYDFSHIFIVDYQYPRWWTERWGWTAFVPRMTNFRNVKGIFSILDTTPTFKRRKNRWRLCDTQLDKLSGLEIEIVRAVHALSSLSGATIIYPPPPRVFGYQKWCQNRNVAEQSVKRSRQWFILWIGLFSYLVAVSETKENSLQEYTYLRIAKWTEHLFDNRFSPTWIDGILSSIICSFDLKKTPRAGIFIKFRRENPNQPPLDWYCKYAVPVWYELGKDAPPVLDKFQPTTDTSSVTEIPSTDEWMSRPSASHNIPENQLSVVTHAQGHSVINSIMAITEVAAPAHSSGPVDADSEWKAFFAAREARNASIIEKEDSTQRQRRLAREREPATKSAKIFEWEQDDDGVYRRRPVLGRFKLETFSNYTKNQRRYDAISNEWDCCEAFAPGEYLSDDDDGDSDMDSESSNNRDAPVNLQSSLEAGARQVQPEISPPKINFDAAVDEEDTLGHDPDTVPSASNVVGLEGDSAEPLTLSANVVDIPYATEDDIGVDCIMKDSNAATPFVPKTDGYVDDASDWLPETLDALSKNPSTRASRGDIIEQEILHRAYLRYGYSLQGELEAAKPLRDERDRRSFVQMMGFRWHPDVALVLERPTISHLAAFLDRVAKGAPVSHLEWDLADSHIHRATLLGRFASLRVVTVARSDTKLYMFDARDQRPVKWNLAMTSAAHALMVCRLDANWDTIDVARYLVGNGIPFKTLQAATKVQKAPYIPDLPSNSLIHPVRPSGYTFSSADYKAYRNRCEELLATPRGGTALMMGGYLWRIAVTVVSLDDALSGPTGWYTDSEKMLVAIDPRTGEEFIDDQLTEAELESLCGMNICLTGSGNQIAKQTWYPLPKTFQYSGQDYGCWTEVLDSIFTIVSEGRHEHMHGSSGYSEASGTENDKSEVLQRQPAAISKWRDLVRGSGSLRRLNLSYNKKAERFIQDNWSRT